MLHILDVGARQVLEVAASGAQLVWRLSAESGLAADPRRVLSRRAHFHGSLGQW